MRTQRRRDSSNSMCVGRLCKVQGDLVTVRAIGSHAVTVENSQGHTMQVRYEELIPLAEQEPTAAVQRAHSLRHTSEQHWAKARQEAAELSEKSANSLTAADVVILASKWGVSRATVWRRAKRFRSEENLSALLKRQRGRKPGTTLLSSEVEFIIGEIARRYWAWSENATVADITAEVHKECRARDLPLPSHATIGRRLKHLRRDPANFTGEARQELRSRTRLVKGNYTIEGSLEVVQIDHTLADLILVDPHTHEAIGRPTLTLAIDIATRCVMGFCASLEAPSCLLVALCLEHAVFPKDQWLSAANSQATWPMFGQMKAIHSDNGKEFHSNAFHRGCDLNGIDVIYRPPATPRFGGHIERLIGTFMRRTRLLPGNTYSDMLGRRPKRTESRATLTLQDYRWFLAEEISRYHKTIHRTLGISPMSAWERAWARSRGKESPRLPRHRDQFLLDFLPLRRRVISREGIELGRLKFSNAELEREIDPNVKRVIRFDPRDISRVYLEREGGTYLTVPVRRNDLAGMSWWEWRAMKRRRVQPTPSSSVFPSTAGLNSLEEATARQETPMRRRKLVARKAEWQELQALQALPVRDVSLQPTTTSEPSNELPAWEILE